MACGWKVPYNEKYKHFTGDQFNSPITNKEKKVMIGYSYECQNQYINICLNECTTRFVHNSWAHKVRIIEILILTCEATAKNVTELAF